MILIFYFLLYFIIILFHSRFYIYRETVNFSPIFQRTFTCEKAFQHVARQFVVSKNQPVTLRSKGKIRTQNEDAQFNSGSKIESCNVCATRCTALRYTRYMQLHIVRYRKHGCDTVLRSTSNSTQYHKQLRQIFFVNKQ